MRIYLLLLLSLFILQGHAQTFEELTNKGLEAEHGNHFSEAINLYYQALKLNPGNYHVYSRLAYNYFSLKNMDSALFYCNAALQLSPRDSSALFYRGFYYMNKEQYDKALPDFVNSFEASDSRNAEACYHIGECFMNLGKFDSAVRYYKLTLTFLPKDKYSFYEVGYCYAAMENPEGDSALKYYNLAIALDNNYYDPYLNRGLLYANVFKNSKKAHLDLDKSIEIRPRNTLSYLYNGILYRGEKEPEKSKDNLDKLIEYHPDYAEAYYQRALTWYQIGILNMVCRDLVKAEDLGHEKAKELREQYCNKDGTPR